MSEEILQALCDYMHHQFLTSEDGSSQELLSLNLHQACHAELRKVGMSKELFEDTRLPK